MHADLIVFAKDYPEVRLLAEVKLEDLAAPDLAMTLKQVAHYMWGANCHHGFIFTPKTTYVLRDDFLSQGPESIHVSATLSTEKLLGRMSTGSATASERQLEGRVHDWLEQLATSYEAALPDDPETASVLFPEIVSAVADGRVVAEAAVR